jgi:hypothetical protein
MIRNCNGHGFARDGGQRQGLQGADERLAAVSRLVVERVPEPDAGGEGHGEAGGNEEATADRVRPSRARPRAHGV